MSKSNSVVEAIERLRLAARSRDHVTLDSEKTAFLKLHGSKNPLIGPGLEMLIGQPDLDEPAKFLAGLLKVDLGPTIANTGTGAIAAGAGSKAAGAHSIQTETYIDRATFYLSDSVKDDQATVLASYLSRVILDCQHLSLCGLDKNASKLDGGRTLDLASVYIGLNTTHVVESEKAEERCPLSALEFLAPPLRLHKGHGKKDEARRSPSGPRYVVILGQPGSGKSTFVNHLCLAIARQDWGRIPEWPEAERDLLPVRVNFRELTPILGDPGAPEFTARADDLVDWIQADLKKKSLPKAGALVARTIEAGKALLILDGLDEIPDRSLRVRARDLAEAVVDRYPMCRVVVTCRLHSYHVAAPGQIADPWVLGPRWDVATLAGFSPRQIDNFIEAWYRELESLGHLSDDRREYVKGLKGAVQRSDMKRMASEPLILTMMAIANTDEGRLPDERTLLYEKLVKLLLWQWDDSNKRENPLSGLLREKQMTENDLIRILAGLAFATTRDGGSDETPGDLSRSDLDKALRRELGSATDDHWVTDMILAMKHRAGLLREEIDDVFRLPHRTFQEYLAGRHLAIQNEFVTECATLLETDPGLWREVALLACGFLVTKENNERDKAVALISRLLHVVGDGVDAGTPCERLAGEAILEIGVQQAERTDLARNTGLVAAVRDRLIDQLVAESLPTATRTEAGRILGYLGDPRPGLGVVDGLPAMEWCEIETGPFFYGEPAKQMKIEHPYRIAKTPVSVAQYECFVKAGGYREEQWWQAGGFGQFESPEDYSLVYQTPNHPRVGVSWYEAMAFSEWLTARLNPDEKHRISLPSEVQWERAARGGPGGRSQCLDWI